MKSRKVIKVLSRLRKEYKQRNKLGKQETVFDKNMPGVLSMQIRLIRLRRRRARRKWKLQR